MHYSKVPRVFFRGLGKGARATAEIVGGKVSKRILPGRSRACSVCYARLNEDKYEIKKASEYKKSMGTHGEAPLQNC